MRAHLVPVALLTLSIAACSAGDPEARQSKRILRSGPQTSDLDTFGDDLDHAVEIADGIFQARAVGNAHLIVTRDGNVVVDTGLPRRGEGERQQKLLRAADDGPVVYVVLTHAHMDHAGGSDLWRGEGTEIIAHRKFMETQRYLKDLAPFFLRRNKVFYPDSVPNVDNTLTRLALKMMYPTFEPTMLIDDTLELELGGVRFEIIPTPGAEGEDSISVWLPQRKILFSGDLFGPLFPMFPNLYTIRGEKIRFPLPYLETLDRIIALEPEMLVPSHFEPVHGAAMIREQLVRTRDALAYVHDATIEGMNDGIDLFTLMREIRLPPHLQLSEGHGKVSWVVRAIWEGYAGWFHFDSTTELYAVPAAAVAPDLVELAGGVDALVERANAHSAAGKPLQALHLIDIATAVEGEHEGALRARIRALTALLELSGGENHSEVMWLHHRIRQSEEALAR